MQTLIIAGVAGKDAVLRRTQAGDPVLGFSLAVDNGKTKDGVKRDATWFDCAVFGKRAEALDGHISKGAKLTLAGRPTCRVHDGKAYLGISVDELTFQGKPNAGEPQREAAGSRSHQRPLAGDDSGEIPF